MKDHEKRELVSELVGIASIAHGTEQLRDRIAYALSGVFSAIDGVTGRADKAESELAKLREQEPVAYVKYKATGGNVGLSWFAIPTQVYYPREGEPLYAGPVPAAPRKYHEFASVMLDAQPFITAETYGGRYIVAMRFERLGKMQDCHAALLALLQSTPTGEPK